MSPQRPRDREVAIGGQGSLGWAAWGCSGHRPSPPGAASSQTFTFLTAVVSRQKAGMEVNLSPAQRRGDVGAGRAPGGDIHSGPRS